MSTTLAPSPSPAPAAELASSTVVTSHEVVVSLVLSAIGGVCFLLLFALVRGTLGYIYHKRTVRGG